MANARAGRRTAVVVGAGHNGLVCGAVLARSGWSVTVLERRERIGGACRTEYPFERAPGVGCSTGAYLLGPMPPEVFEAAGLRGRVRLIPRRPHGYFLTSRDEPVAFGVRGGDEFLSARDRRAMNAVDDLLAQIREDLGACWLDPACTSARSIAMVRNDPAPEALGGSVRGIYERLLTGSVAEFLDPLGFEDDMLKATIATDGLVGSGRGYFDSGTGHNFLVHNMLRLPAGDGAWDSPPLGAWQLVEGGMGSITRALGEVIVEQGGEVRTGVRVRGVEHGVAGSVRVLMDPARGAGVIEADAVVLACDPRTAESLLEAKEIVPRAWTRSDLSGTSLKVNMALSRLPRVEGVDRQSALEGRDALCGTVHVLPTKDPIQSMERARRTVVERGEMPDPFDCMIDVYTHTAVDGSLRDDHGRHAMSLFVQWVPYSASQAEIEAFADRLIKGPVARVLPALPSLVEDRLVLGPAAIEARFGIMGGHIHHVDNARAFEERRPTRRVGDRVILCGAGWYPAGSVVGVSGMLAAGEVMGMA